MESSEDEVASLRDTSLVLRDIERFSEASGGCPQYDTIVFMKFAWPIVVPSISLDRRQMGVVLSAFPLEPGGAEGYSYGF
jgi:hypothetical protein